MVEKFNFHEWKVIYFDLTKEDLENFSNLKEDLIQVNFWNVILDVWYYKNRFKVYIIKNYDWEKPVEVIDCWKNINLLIESVNLSSEKLSKKTWD
jgi:hypothetical protein